MSCFTGAHLGAHASVPACGELSMCCLNVRRTVVALLLGSAHDPGGYRHLLFELHAAASGHVAAGGPGEERGRAARAMCRVRPSSKRKCTSGSICRVYLRV